MASSTVDLMSALAGCDIEALRASFLAAAESPGVGLQRETFFQVLAAGCGELQHLSAAALTSLFYNIDGNNSGRVTWDEFYSFALDSAVQRMQTRPAETVRPYSLSRTLPRDDNVLYMRYLPTLDQIIVSSRHRPLEFLDPLSLRVQRSLRPTDIQQGLTSAAINVVQHYSAGNCLAAYCGDLRMRLWQISENALMPLKTMLCDSYITQLQSPPELPYLFASTREGSLVAYDLNRASEMRPRTTWLIHHNNGAGLVAHGSGGSPTRNISGSEIINDFCFINAAQGRVATASMDHSLIITDLGLDNSAVRGTTIGRSKTAIMKMDYAEGHSYIGAVSVDNSVSAWVCHQSVNACTPLSDPSRPHRGTVIGIHCIPRSPQLVSTDSTGTIKVWDLRMFACAHTINQNAQQEAGAGGDGEERNHNRDRSSHGNEDDARHKAVEGNGVNGGGGGGAFTRGASRGRPGGNGNGASGASRGGSRWGGPPASSDSGLGGTAAAAAGRKSTNSCYVPLTNEVVTSDTNGLSCFEYDQGSDPTIADENLILGVSYNANSNTFVTSSARTVGVWDAQQGVLISQFRETGRTDISAMCMDQRGRRIFIGMQDGSLELRSYHGGTLVRRLRVHDAQVTNIAFSDHHRILVSTSRDGSLAAYNEGDGGDTVSRLSLGPYPLVSLAVCSVLGLVATGNDQGKTALTDFTHPRVVIGEGDGPACVTALCFLGQFPLLAAAYSNAEIIFWTVRPALEMTRLYSFNLLAPTVPMSNAVRSTMAPSSSGAHRAMGRASSPVADSGGPPSNARNATRAASPVAASAARISSFRTGSGGGASVGAFGTSDDNGAAATALAFDSDRHTLFVADEGGRVSSFMLCPLLQVAGIKTATYPGTNMFPAPKVTSRTALAAAAPLRLSTFVAHTDEVCTMEFLPAFKLLVTAGSDRRVLLWNSDGTRAGELSMGRVADDVLPAAELRKSGGGAIALGATGSFQPMQAMPTLGGGGSASKNGPLRDGADGASGGAAGRVAITRSLASRIDAFRLVRAMGASPGPGPVEKAESWNPDAGVELSSQMSLAAAAAAAATGSVNGQPGGLFWGTAGTSGKRAGGGKPCDHILPSAVPPSSSAGSVALPSDRAARRAARLRQAAAANGAASPGTTPPTATLPDAASPATMALIFDASVCPESPPTLAPLRPFSSVQGGGGATTPHLSSDASGAVSVPPPPLLTPVSITAASTSLFGDAAAAAAGPATADSAGSAAPGPLTADVGGDLASFLPPSALLGPRRELASGSTPGGGAVGGGAPRPPPLTLQGFGGRRASDNHSYGGATGSSAEPAMRSRMSPSPPLDGLSETARSDALTGDSDTSVVRAVLGSSKRHKGRMRPKCHPQEPEDRRRTALHLHTLVGGAAQAAAGGSSDVSLRQTRAPPATGRGSEGDVQALAAPASPKQPSEWPALECDGTRVATEGNVNQPTVAVTTADVPSSSPSLSGSLFSHGRSRDGRAAEDAVRRGAPDVAVVPAPEAGTSRSTGTDELTSPLLPTTQPKPRAFSHMAPPALEPHLPSLSSTQAPLVATTVDQPPPDAIPIPAAAEASAEPAPLTEADLEELWAAHGALGLSSLGRYHTDRRRADAWREGLRRGRAERDATAAGDGARMSAGGGGRTAAGAAGAGAAGHATGACHAAVVASLARPPPAPLAEAAPPAVPAVPRAAFRHSSSAPAARAPAPPPPQTRSGVHRGAPHRAAAVAALGASSVPAAQALHGQFREHQATEERMRREWRLRGVVGPPPASAGRSGKAQRGMAHSDGGSGSGVSGDGNGGGGGEFVSPWSQVRHAQAPLLGPGKPPPRRPGTGPQGGGAPRGAGGAVAAADAEPRPDARTQRLAVFQTELRRCLLWSAKPLVVGLVEAGAEPRHWRTPMTRWELLHRAHQASEDERLGLLEVVGGVETDDGAKGDAVSVQE